MPAITEMTTEIRAFIQALEKIKQEQHLFEFLNGLDEEYSAQRSQLLLQSPLPTVEEACASLQQEEEQREVLNVHKVNTEASAMNIRGPKAGGYSSFGAAKTTKIDECKASGKKGHPARKCWTIVGYPKGHYKSIKQAGMYRKEGGM
ncbi:Ubiquitin carboxyl-terminal hydrolase 1 [Bienertia sinuspersici]